MPYRVDARLTGRHPFQNYLVGFMIVIGGLFCFNIIPHPPSVAGVLPAWAVILWAWLLFLSSLAAMVGTHWRDRATGLILEQLGLFALGAVTIFLAVAMFIVNGASAAIAGGFLGGFGVACLKRWYDIQKILDQVHAIEKQQKRKGS